MHLPSLLFLNIIHYHKWLWSIWNSYISFNEIYFLYKTNISEWIWWLHASERLLESLDRFCVKCGEADLSSIMRGKLVDKVKPGLVWCCAAMWLMTLTYPKDILALRFYLRTEDLSYWEVWVINTWTQRNLNIYPHHFSACAAAL